ncbi:MAG: hypothetical protein O2797_05155 [Bacteroidetes bacterium]|nr:hypothetical protein [Bacteroidota bacterium]MDA1333587.1 hypothetical protein [Bacteroidota bacterium]
MKGSVSTARCFLCNVTGMLWSLFALAIITGMTGCAPQPMADTSMSSTSMPTSSAMMSTEAPSPDPRVGLGAGLFDAEEAIWNLNKLSTTPPSEPFVGVTSSDLAFKGNYVFQGNYNGVMIWDVSNPSMPVLVKDYVCPASQSDVSVYGDLMFVSGEGTSGRLDCGDQGVDEAVSAERLRGIRIFDISDIREPKYIHNVQTCRGSHTHSVLKDPDVDDTIWIYVSGSSSVRSEEELPGCSAMAPSEDPNSALFRIEVIRVPLDAPETAEIVSSPRIFEDLVAPPQHGMSPADLRVIEEAKANGAFVADIFGQERILSGRMLSMVMTPFMESRGGGEPNAADSAAFREALPEIIAAQFGNRNRPESVGPAPGPTQCHDITLYPEIGMAGGACGGYGLLLDINDPENPFRMDAAADSNFSYWHSATFSNDGSKMLFTDEWGGGGQPKCREDDPKEWGANAHFTIEDGKLTFESYWKLPAPQTNIENCVAHNGSMIPIPGREVFVQSWYQGGISVYDWTDINNPHEIGFHDRGPSDAETQGPGGSWSVYWYNGLIVSSEIARGLDIFELKPSGFISENEIAAAKTVQLDYLNAQGQPMYYWPTTFALAQSYVDQLERSKGLSTSRIATVRQALKSAEGQSGSTRSSTLSNLAGDLQGWSDAKVQALADVVQELAGS